MLAISIEHHPLSFLGGKAPTGWIDGDAVRATEG